MKVEALKTIKGSELWRRGTVFDDTVSPIPRDILLEVAQGARTVRVLPEPMRIKHEPPVEEPFSDLSPGMSENFIVPEEEESPEAATEDNVAAETDNEIPIANENLPKHLPELEGLIQMKGTIAAVSRLLDVSYTTVTKWRKGSTPKPDMLKKIKQEHGKLMRLTDDQDRVDDSASAGIEGAHLKP